MVGASVYLRDERPGLYTRLAELVLESADRTRYAMHAFQDADKSSATVRQMLDTPYLHPDIM